MRKKGEQKAEDRLNSINDGTRKKTRTWVSLLFPIKFDAGSFRNRCMCNGPLYFDRQRKNKLSAKIYSNLS